MNYGVIPETIVERAAVWSGRMPIPMIDLLFGPLKAGILMAGATLGVFEALRDGRRGSYDLARALGLDGPAVELLLRALVHVKYLRQRGDAFELSALGRSTMIAGAQHELTGFARWSETQWTHVETLEAFVRTGRGLDVHQTLTGEGKWRDYQRAMLEAARYDTATLIRLVPVSAAATRLVDLGGSHGLHGAAICRAHPPMRSTVVDLSEAIAHSRSIAREQRLDDIVEHRVGDLRRDRFEECDVALLANVLHHFTAMETADLFCRVRAALRRRGTIAVWEYEGPDLRRSAGHGDLIALFFKLTSSAEALHGDQYAGLLADAGFVNIRAIRPLVSPGRVFVVGRVPKSTD
jgi:hypothetical protein